MTRVVLVDDDRTFITLFHKYLSLEPNIDIIGVASNGYEALEVVATTQPNVVVMDIKMPVLNGVGATRALRTLHPSCKILLLTSWGDDEYVWEGIRAGAHGYKYKDTQPAEVARAIQAVARGEIVVDPLAVEKMMTFLRRAPMPVQLPADDQLLTKREQHILQLLAAGLSNHAIADRLGIVEPTVKTHVNHILAKLDATSRTDAVRQACLRGLL